MKHYDYILDEYGNNVRDTNPTTSTYPARLEQTDSTEIQIGANTEISNWRIYLPAEAILDAEDQVLVEGKTFEAIGPPDVERSPRGSHHITARLRYTQ